LEIEGAGCANAITGATVSATGCVWRIKTWHCPQQSRDENAGPDAGPDK
jgi:hypothetical protein